MVSILYPLPQEHICSILLTYNQQRRDAPLPPVDVLALVGGRSEWLRRQEIILKQDFRFWWDLLSIHPEKRLRQEIEFWLSERDSEDFFGVFLFLDEIMDILENVGFAAAFEAMQEPPFESMIQPAFMDMHTPLWADVSV